MGICLLPSPLVTEDRVEGEGWWGVSILGFFTVHAWDVHAPEPTHMSLLRPPVPGAWSPKPLPADLIDVHDILLAMR